MRLSQSILSLALCLVGLVTHARADWPGVMGPDRDNKSPDKGLLKEWPKDGPTRLWKAEGLGEGFSSLSISADTIYTAGDINKRFHVIALTLDGKPKWQVDIDAGRAGNNGGARSTPVLDGNRLYIITAQGKLVCLEAADGKIVWERKMSDLGGQTPGWGWAESPLPLADKLIVTPGGKKPVAALDKATGKTLWVSGEFPGKVQYCSARLVKIAGTDMIVTGSGGGFFGLSPEDGKILWSNTFCTLDKAVDPEANPNASNCNTISVFDDMVCWPNGYKRGAICLKITKTDTGFEAKELWKNVRFINDFCGAVTLDGHIYGTHSGGYICYELATGKEKWYDNGPTKGSICYADGMFYLFSHNGRAALVVPNPEKYEEKSRFQVEGEGPAFTYPVIHNQRMYLRRGSVLHCYDIKAN